jgi:hypothetical protein
LESRFALQKFAAAWSTTVVSTARSYCNSNEVQRRGTESIACCAGLKHAPKSTPATQATATPTMAGDFFFFPWPASLMLAAPRRR